MEYELILSDLNGYLIHRSDNLEELKQSVIKTIKAYPFAELLPAMNLNIFKELDEQFWTELIKTRLESPHYRRHLELLNKREMYVLYSTPNL